ncbi:hypothetical protein K438DRAFT_1774051 [Mycena galopus ATCC 62051]|nr:hypothetical protein K438DRAFT_1774051 [Mycena galopus ATCC 62051]
MGPKKKNGPVVARLNEPTPTPPISIVGGSAAGDQVPAMESSSPARIPSTSKGKGHAESPQRPESKVDDDDDSSSLESETVIQLEVVQDDLGEFDLDKDSQDKRPNSVFDNVSPRAPVNPASSPPPNNVPMDDSSPIKPKQSTAGRKAMPPPSRAAHMRPEFALKLMAVRIGLEKVNPSNSRNIDGWPFWVPACLAIDGVHTFGSH